MQCQRNNMAILIVVASLWLYSCGITKKSSLNKEELLEYVSDPRNGLTKEQEASGIRVKLSFFPSSMLAVEQVNDQSAMDTAAFKKAQSNYKDHYYFKARFSKDGKEAIRQLGDFSRYSEMVQVLAFRMNNYINLTTPNKDTLLMADYFFDQTYGMNDANNLLLVFNKEQLKNVDQFNINIGECGFGTGALRFSFKKEDIEKLPALSYE